jgi:hypothetical protein
MASAPAKAIFHELGFTKPNALRMLAAVGLSACARDARGPPRTCVHGGQASAMPCDALSC